MPEVELESGVTVLVRRLGLFELEGKGPALIGPFLYEYELPGGQKVMAEYDLLSVTTPPEPPSIPEEEVEPRSELYWRWIEYHTYQAALRHEGRRQESLAAHLTWVSTYIRDNCLRPQDVAQVLTPEDWLRVHRAALVPQVDRALLADVFQRVYQAEYDGEPLLEAMDRLKPGSGSYEVIRSWEVQLQIEMGLSETAYLDLPLEERAVKIAAVQIPRIIESLTMEDERRRLERERAQEKVKRG